ncbi:thioredoxin family protein [Lysobacter sp. 2RAF19]
MSFAHRYEPTEPERASVDVRAGPAVLEFGAPWCGHCIAAQSPLEAAFATHADVHHLKIEDGRGQPLGRSFRVKLWPTLIFLRDGEEVARLVRPTTPGPIAEALAIIDPPTPP